MAIGVDLGIELESIGYGFVTAVQYRSIEIVVAGDVRDIVPAFRGAVVASLTGYLVH